MAAEFAVSMAFPSRATTAEKRSTAMWRGEAKWLKQLEEENLKLEHVLPELTLDKRALKAVLAKSF